MPHRPILIVSFLAALLPVAAFGFLEENDLFIHPFLTFVASGQGMGNAVGSLPAHPSNIWVNPAGLAHQEGWSFYGAPHDEVTDFFEDRHDRIFSTSYRLSSRSAMGAAFLTRDSDNRPFVFPGESEISHIDVDERAYYLAYALRFGTSWSAGATLLGFSQTGSDPAIESGNVFGATVGLLHTREYSYSDNAPPARLRFGLSVANIASSFEIGGEDSNLPLNARLAGSAEWDRGESTTLTVAADVYSPLRSRTEITRTESEELGFGDRIGWGAGLEARLQNVVALRVGWLDDSDISRGGRSGGTFGFGVGHEVHKRFGGMLEYSRSVAWSDSADHIGLRFYYRPGATGRR